MKITPGNGLKPPGADCVVTIQGDEYMVQCPRCRRMCRLVNYETWKSSACLWGCEPDAAWPGDMESYDMMGLLKPPG